MATWKKLQHICFMNKIPHTSKKKPIHSLRGEKGRANDKEFTKKVNA